MNFHKSNFTFFEWKRIRKNGWIKTFVSWYWHYEAKNHTHIHWPGSFHYNECHPSVRIKLQALKSEARDQLV